MNRISSEHLVDEPDAARTPVAARTTLILVAWVSTLLLSKLPLVFARDVLGTDISWIIPAWVGTVALFLAATFAWQVLKPLRAYFAIMGVILLLGFSVDPLVKQSGSWTNFIAGQSPMVILLGERALLVVETLIVLAALFLFGVKWREAFLRAGNMTAPVGGKTPSDRRSVMRWPLFGTLIALLLGGLFFAFLSSQSQGAVSNLSRAVPWIPLILLTAAMNAFSEEATYRAAPLSTLLPAVGSNHALFLTSLWFGLGHYYGGIPSGPVGLIQTGLLALLLGRAMLDTRGLGWSWIIHVVLDTVIYTFIAIS